MKHTNTPTRQRTNTPTHETIVAASVELVEQFPDEAGDYANAGDLLLAGEWGIGDGALIFSPGGRVHEIGRIVAIVALVGRTAGQCSCQVSQAGATCIHERALDILVGAGLISVAKTRQRAPVTTARAA